MYKVFFNNNVLILNNAPLKGLEFKQTLNANKDKIDFNGVLEMLYKQNDEGMSVLVYGDDLKSLWKAFSQCFKFLEAAGGIVVNEEGKYLFIERNGKWDVPKGKREKGETIDECALREITEECGIENLTIERKLLETYHTYQLKGKDILKRTTWYLLSHRGIANLFPQAEEGITQVKWLTKQEINTEVMPNTYLSVKELVSGFIGKN